MLINLFTQSINSDNGLFTDIIHVVRSLMLLLIVL